MRAKSQRLKYRGEGVCASSAIPSVFGLSEVQSKIRIVQVPPGQAPLWVRESWVGLELPLHRNLPARKRLTVGVLDRPSLAGLVWNLIRRRAEFTTGYAVETLRAIEILDAAHPRAAAWWRRNTPHLLMKNRFLIFPTDMCEKVDS